jgi:hypothetical protein
MSLFHRTFLYLPGLKYIEEMAKNGPTELRIALPAADNSNALFFFQNSNLGHIPDMYYI